MTESGGAVRARVHAQLKVAVCAAKSCTLSSRTHECTLVWDANIFYFRRWAHSCLVIRTLLHDVPSRWIFLIGLYFMDRNVLMIATHITNRVYPQVFHECIVLCFCRELTFLFEYCTVYGWNRKLAKYVRVSFVCQMTQVIKDAVVASKNVCDENVRVVRRAFLSTPTSNPLFLPSQASLYSFQINYQ
jgi:hypothetical protein